MKSLYYQFVNFIQTMKPIWFTTIWLLGMALVFVFIMKFFKKYNGTQKNFDKLSLLFLAILVFALIVYLRSVEFFCTKCETQFKAKNIDVILGVHTLSKRYLRCPNCGEKSWCQERIVERDNHRD